MDPESPESPVETRLAAAVVLLVFKIGPAALLLAMAAAMALGRLGFAIGGIGLVLCAALPNGKSVARSGPRSRSRPPRADLHRRLCIDTK